MNEKELIVLVLGALVALVVIVKFWRYLLGLGILGLIAGTAICSLGMQACPVQWPWPPIGGAQQAIDQWAREYCGTASSFLRNSLAPSVQLQGGWEMSYAFIQNYTRVRDEAARSAAVLSGLSAPGPARGLHDTTIQSMYRVASAARDAINQINHATNAHLFINAVNRYNQRVVEQVRILEDATVRSGPVVSGPLQSCTLNIMSGSGTGMRGY